MSSEYDIPDIPPHFSYFQMSAAETRCKQNTVGRCNRTFLVYIICLLGSLASVTDGS